MVSLHTAPHLHVCQSVTRARAKWSVNALQCCEAIYRGLGVVAENILWPAGTRGARKRSSEKMIGGGVMPHHATPNHFHAMCSSARRTCQQAVKAS